MRKLLYSISMSLIILFIYWVSIYYASGYNLTDNVAHLDLSSMIKTFTNDLNSNNQFVFTSSGLNIFDKFNNYFNNLFEKFTYLINNDLSTYTGSNSIFKLVINAVNILVKSFTTLLQPINLLISIINNIVYAVAKTLYFFKCFIKFLLEPIFI